MRTSTHLSTLIRLSILLALVVSLLPPTRTARAASFTVNSLLDNTTAGDGLCTLREAIETANNAGNGDCGANSTGDDTITFSVSGTITLSSTLPAIVSASTAGNLTINGDGTIIISGNNAVRVMEVNSGADLTLQNLTIANGSINTSYGGGISNNFGMLTVTNSTFSGNSADYGGGIDNNGGTLTVTGSTFSNNSATSEGGGIFNNGGTLTVTNSTFSQNSANYGGGIGNSPSTTLTVTGSTFSDNSGGGIANGGTLTVTGSTFSDNSTNNSGGGILNYYGMATVMGSTFSNNSADYGGGIENDNGTLTVTNSTFSNNSAVQQGGGIFNETGGTLTVTNSTFSSNSADATGSGEGLHVDSGTATLRNTIIANSVNGRDCVGTLSGTNNNNLIESAANACGLTHGSSGNIIGFDPNLGALTGSPAYFPLNTGSPAIDAGDNATCAAAPVNNQSQNGVTRPQDGDANGTKVCDIGSYEHPDLPPALLSFTRHDPATSPTNAGMLVFRATFSEAVQNVDAADFSLNASPATTVITAVAQVTPSLYEITVSGGNLSANTYNGVIGLDLAAGQNITDPAGNPLPAGEPATDETYTVDNTAPVLLSFTRHNPLTSPTNASTLVFRATFSEAVQNVNAADFTLNAAPATTASITAVTLVTPSLYEITVSGGDLSANTYNGVIGLNLAAGQNITDPAGNPLPTTEPATDETYTIENVIRLYLPLIVR